MTRSTTLLALLAASTLSSSVSAKSLKERTWCSLDSDCSGLIPDIWSLVGCHSGTCVKSCKSGCASTGSGCAPTSPIQSCPSGQAWNPLTRGCINILSDINHCGGFQNSCGSDPLATNIWCSGGSCQKTCHSSCSKDSANNCVPSTPSACGTGGKSCAAPTSHGVATCSSGVCGIQCDSGFTLSGSDCVLINTPQSCGLSKLSCPTYGAGTTATCTNGVCGVQCTNGGCFNSQTKSCASSQNYCGIFPLGRTCPTVANGKTYCNGLTCAVSCDGGYVSSSDATGILGFSTSLVSSLLGGGSLGCIPATQNNKCCGLSGKTCSTSLPNCVSNCFAGSCVISGADGYTYSPSAGACVPTTTTSDCGSLGFSCYAPPNSTPTCKKVGSWPVCSYNCNSGYTPFLFACVPIQASYRAKAKRHTKAAIGFCPDNEEACPISGSNSLKQALIGAASGTGFLQYAQPTGGYECLDTQTSLESCGGCASTGAGKDCTRISRAKTMGCDAGQCVVFECERGFRPNDTMDGCERLPSKGHKRPFSLTHKANSRAHTFSHKLSL